MASAGASAGTVLPVARESLGTAPPARASDLCPFCTCGKTFTNLLALPRTSCHGGGDLANPLPGRALGGDDRPRLLQPWHPREPKGRRTPPPAASRSALQPGRRTTLQRGARTAADVSRTPARAREQERNHGPRLPAPLGPGGPGRQLRRLGELGGRSGAAKAVLRGCSGHQLELPP